MHTARRKCRSGDRCWRLRTPPRANLTQSAQNQQFEPVSEVVAGEIAVPSFGFPTHGGLPWERSQWRKLNNRIRRKAAKRTRKTSAPFAASGPAAACAAVSLARANRTLNRGACRPSDKSSAVRRRRQPPRRRSIAQRPSLGLRFRREAVTLPTPEETLFCTSPTTAESSSARRSIARHRRLRCAWFRVKRSIRPDG